MKRLGEILLDERPPVRAMIVWNSNPLVIVPNAERAREGMARDDLFTVVHEQFLTDTARYADIVLPATTQIESDDVVLPWGHLWIGWNGATIVYTNGRYHVLPLSEAVRGHLTPQIGSADWARGYEVRAVLLQDIASTEMAKILEPYAREGAILNADAFRNMIFLAGTPEELFPTVADADGLIVQWVKITRQVMEILQQSLARERRVLHIQKGCQRQGNLHIQ